MLLSVSKPSCLMNLGLIWAYFGLPRDKPTKLNLSEFKKISDFPDAVNGVNVSSACSSFC